MRIIKKNAIINKMIKMPSRARVLPSQWAAGRLVWVVVHFRLTRKMPAKMLCVQASDGCASGERAVLYYYMVASDREKITIPIRARQKNGSKVGLYFDGVGR